MSSSNNTQSHPASFRASWMYSDPYAYQYSDVDQDEGRDDENNSSNNARSRSSSGSSTPVSSYDYYHSNNTPSSSSSFSGSSGEHVLSVAAGSALPAFAAVSELPGSTPTPRYELPGTSASASHASSNTSPSSSSSSSVVSRHRSSSNPHSSSSSSRSRSSAQSPSRRIQPAHSGLIPVIFEEEMSISMSAPTPVAMPTTTAAAGKHYYCPPQASSVLKKPSSSIWMPLSKSKSTSHPRPSPPAYGEGLIPVDETAAKPREPSSDFDAILRNIGPISKKDKTSKSRERSSRYYDRYSSNFG